MEELIPASISVQPFWRNGSTNRLRNRRPASFHYNDGKEELAELAAMKEEQA